jgi:hypothetical protein
LSHRQGNTAPVLLIAFNRPDLVSQVLEAVGRASPRDLFVAIDGPRRDYPADRPRCEEVRAIVEELDWPAQVHLKTESENLGVRCAVESAVSWALDCSSEIIVLEDDCLPDPMFMDFCDELLARYRHDARVMQIAGTNWGADPLRFGAYSYAFTSFAPVWGWATWRRAWELYDHDFASWRRIRGGEIAEGMALSRRFRKLLEPEWDLVLETGGEWDRKWQYSVLRHHGLSVCPRRNLVRNIGFRPDGTHLTHEDQVFSNLPLEALDLPVAHPPEVARNRDVEAVFERIYWQKRGWPAVALSRLIPHEGLNRALRRAARRMISRPS